MLNRREILTNAYCDCMREMYAKSQPEADWDNLVQEYKDGKIGKDENVYERHHLSKDEYKYILSKYKKAYNIKSHWREDVEVVETYLDEGGHKDKWIPDHTDEDGFTHPGYRSYEEVPPIKEQIKEILDSYLYNKEVNTTREQLAEEITKTVMDTISNCKEYYRFDREESDFSCDIALGASPCSNPEIVKKWWKENYDQDIEIEERNPILFWYRDKEYTDEELAEEFETDNWREVVDEQWNSLTEEQKRNYYEE